MGLGDFGYSLKWAFQGLLKKPLALAKKLFENKLYKFVAIIFLGLLVLTPLSIVLAIQATKNAKTKAAPLEFKADTVSEEELFIPDEPDFLPKVIFEEPKRKSWDSDEAASFWTDPSDYPDNEWKDRITESLDGLLERIP